MIEAVIACDGFGDFLEETIPYTLRHVDNLVVATHRDDKHTQAVCNRHDVRCVKTWVHERQARFDKAALINEGLRHLSCQDWILHLDADVVIPDRFDTWFAEHRPDPKNIYGVDRYNVESAEDWDAIRESGYLEARREWGYLIHPPKGLTKGSRVGHGAYHGWLPIGFFQLWHAGRETRYATKPFGTAEHTDVLHAGRWEPESRILIPDFYVLHLTNGKSGENWAGRRSPPFRPEHGYDV